MASIIDWIKMKLTGKTAEEIAAKKRKKRGAKAYHKRVRAREEALRVKNQGGGYKAAKFFWGHPFESYDHTRHGNKKTKPMAKMPAK